MTDAPPPDPLLPSIDDPWGYRGRRAVVTGAASGIGRAATEILVAVGAEVIALDRAPVETVGVAAAHQVDLSDPAAIDAAARAIGGPVDALFNCAGVPGTADDRTVFAVNFCGTRRCTEALVGQMPPGSAICNIGSTAAVNWPYHVDRLLELLTIDDPDTAIDWLLSHIPELGYAYDVSKEAVNTYTAWRGTSLLEQGIRMNCINPGGTRTPASRDFSTAVKAKTLGPEMLAHWPMLMGRMARPGEQAWPMVFLNSPFASFASGTSLFVDAGLTSGLFTGQHHEAVAAGMFWRPPMPTPPATGTSP